MYIQVFQINSFVYAFSQFHGIDRIKIKTNNYFLSFNFNLVYCSIGEPIAECYTIYCT